ncbi:MAG: calcium/sodium antiporter [Gammaproteobacteria bacterium]|nr:calcium/sodium antiporter [Gammaproteobacteria bacterium]
MLIILFITGLLFLIVGAEILVRGASRMAAALGMSPLIIGLTVVAFGTSSPELSVSIKSALSGQAGIAVGNVVGSNIFNVLFILGVTAIIAPLFVSQKLVRFDLPIMIAISILALLLSLDHTLSRLDGGILFIGLVAYIGFLLYQGRKEQAAADKQNNHASKSGRRSTTWLVNIVMVVTGLGLLVLGSQWLVESAIVFAKYLGVSELIIGLTIVAAGTSLPEVVTSIIAAIRGERDIAVGNVVGSNIFNILGVLGVTGLIAPAGIEISSSVIGFDMLVMIAVALVCLPLFVTGGIISRMEGIVLLGYYVAYTVYLILASSHHAALPMFSAVMLLFVIPLTALSVTLLALNEIRRKKAE